MDASVSSSSEERYTRKRERSRTRKDVKGSKKRARRCSDSCDSIEDSLHARKRKKAKRKNEDDEKTWSTSSKKKKISREPSVSSRSFSTCHGGSASNYDSEYKNSRERSTRKETDERALRGKSGSEKSDRYRARSCSPCSSPCNESIYEGTEEKYTTENKSRRLRSVITVIKKAEESRELCANETKEEIVDDHDYPCRSNDRNDGGTKRELDHHTDPLSEEKLIVEDETGDMNADLNFTVPKLRDTNYSDGSSLKAYSAGTSELTKKETSDTSGANLNGDDLESILRQRALENFRRKKNKIVSQVKQSVTDKDELVQGKSNNSSAIGGTKFDKQTPVEETSLPVWRKNLVVCPRNNEIILSMEKDIPGSAKHQLACAPEKVIDADNPSGVVTESINNKAGNLDLKTSESFHDSLRNSSSLKLTTVSGLPREKLAATESTKDKSTFEAALVLSHNSKDNIKGIKGMASAVPKPPIQRPKFKPNNLNKAQDDVNDHSQSELKQTSDSHKPPNAKLSVTEVDEERNVAETTQSAIQSINNSGRGVDESGAAATPESGITSSSVENNSGTIQGGEINQSSQFEQKTMTVTRGGELVQVSL